MLLTENIANRYREWRDRANTQDEPDLVDRYRRLWREPSAGEPKAARAGLARRLTTLRAASGPAGR